MNNDFISSRPELIDMTPKEKVEQVVPEVERRELPENIRKFDERVRKPFNLYDYNVVAARPAYHTPTASEAVLSPVHNYVGKFLGVDTKHGWQQDYDKVDAIVNWMRDKTGKEDPLEAIDWITEQLKSVPSLGSTQRRIDQLYIYAKLNHG